MTIWLEIIGSHREREGKYLICPVHSSTKKNNPIYRILEDVKQGDVVLHYVLKKAGGQLNAITSYSRVSGPFYLVEKQDSHCSYLPPYRKVDLVDNIRLNTPITMYMLTVRRVELESIAAEDPNRSRKSPFDKNFRIKQLYLSRIPLGFINVFSDLCGSQILLK